MTHLLKFTYSLLMFISYCIWHIKGEEMIDLSYSFDENTVFWPNGLPFRFTKKRADSSNGYWYAANDFMMSEHSGTHLDAPYHFNKLGWKARTFLNVSSDVYGNCSYKLPSEKLADWEKNHRHFPNNSVLLISFGWASRYDNKHDYFGPPGELCFPGISKEASIWITESRKIVGVGVDGPSVDQGENVETHRQLNSNNIYMLENLAIKQPLPPIFKIVVMPMKIALGTGGPCRVIAIV